MTLSVFSQTNESYDDFAAERDLEILLDATRTAYETREPMIVLLLDEVDTFQRYDRSIRQRFRAFCQEMQRQLRVVLVGVLPPRAEVGENSPWYNIFEPIVMEPLSETAIQSLIRTYNQNPYSYTLDAEKAILEASDGKPFDTQWLCSEAVKSMLATKPGRVTVADVQHAKQVVVRERSQFYITLWKQLPEAIQSDIRTAIECGGLLPSQSLAEPMYDRLFTEGIALRTLKGARLAHLFQEWYRSTYVR